MSMVPEKRIFCSIYFLEESFFSVHISFINCTFFSLAFSFFIVCKPLMRCVCVCVCVCVCYIVKLQKKKE